MVIIKLNMAIVANKIANIINAAIYMIVYMYKITKIVSGKSIRIIKL